jgi:CBS domain-containing protein
MHTAEILQRNVVTVQPGDELLWAARLMRERHVGYLVVVEPGLSDGTLRPVGVLTDRDIVVAVIAREIDPRSLRVEDVMTRKPVVAGSDESLPTVLREMRRIGVRRMPVIGDHGELVGVMSLDDVVAALSAQLQEVAGSIRSEQAIEHTLRPG